MPVIGRGDGDGIDFLILKRLANVFIFLWRFALGTFNHLCAVLEHVGIHVTKRDIFGIVFRAEDILDMRATLAMKSDRANADAVIGSEHLAGSHGPADQHCRGGLPEKLSSSKLHVVMSGTCSLDSERVRHGFQGSKFVEMTRIET